LIFIYNPHLRLFIFQYDILRGKTGEYSIQGVKKEPKKIGSFLRINF